MGQHSDSFAKAAQPDAQTPQEAPKAAPKKTSNEAQAALAETERQREFTVGGDAPPSPSSPAAPATRIETAIARIRVGDRASPFGTSHFPPLPAPPERGRSAR